MPINDGIVSLGVEPDIWVRYENELRATYEQQAQARAERMTWTETSEYRVESDTAIAHSFFYSPFAQRYDRIVKKQETAHIKQLIASGIIIGFQLSVHNGTQLIVRGENWGAGEIVFVVDLVGGIIRANKKRASHIKALLETFAAAHEYTVEFTTDEFHFEQSEPLAYWSFNPGEVDDTALVANINPRELRRQETEMPDDDYYYLVGMDDVDPSE